MIVASFIRVSIISEKQPPEEVNYPGNVTGKIRCVIGNPQDIVRSTFIVKRVEARLANNGLTVGYTLLLRRAALENKVFWDEVDGAVIDNFNVKLH